MDPVVEREAREWIEKVTGDAFTGKDFQDSLKDGLLLCKCVPRRERGQGRSNRDAARGRLINVIKPGSVTKTNASKMPFAMRVRFLCAWACLRPCMGGASRAILLCAEFETIEGAVCTGEHLRISTGRALRRHARVRAV